MNERPGASDRGAWLVVTIIALLALPLFLFFFGSPVKDDQEQEQDAVSVGKSTQKVAVSIPSSLKKQKKVTASTSDEDAKNATDTNWRCACQGGFLPPGLLKSLGGAEAFMRMSAGQCYHNKQQS